MDDVTDREWLVGIALKLKLTTRQGAERDEPEGSCYIQMSHTLAVSIAARMNEIAGRITP